MPELGHVWCEMAPIDLNLLRVFAIVYQAGSFTAAARKLGVPRSTVSRAIAALEDRVGDELIHRTTRTMSISAEGKLLFDRIAPSLTGLEAALGDLPGRAGAELTGTVRATSTPDIGATVLAEAAVRFTARFPGTQVDLRLTGEVLDLARGDCDVALRIARSRMPDSRLIARKVGTLVFHLFAAPTYLARRGAPRSPTELADHDWIDFLGIAPEKVGVAARKRGLTAPGGRIMCDDIFTLRELIRRGGGIAGMPSFLADDDLQAGTLMRVLPKFTLMAAPVYLVHAVRTHQPPRVTAFCALVLELLRQRPLAPAE
jgi:DNA-binding transcriptional LysR family regulator